MDELCEKEVYGKGTVSASPQDRVGIAQPGAGELKIKCDLLFCNLRRVQAGLKIVWTMCAAKSYSDRTSAEDITHGSCERARRMTSAVFGELSWRFVDETLHLLG